MNRLKISKHYLIAGVICLLIILLLVGLYSMRTAAIKTEFQELQRSLIKEYVDNKKERMSSVIHTLTQKFHKEHKLVEESAVYELKKKVDHAYESAHQIARKYNKTKKKQDLQERIIDTLSYGMCEDEDTLFISTYDANTILSQNAQASYEALDVDADGRTIALEMIQKVRKYSETYIYTNTLSKTRELIYAKNLDLYDWFVWSSVDLTKKYRSLEQNFINEVVSLALSKRDFVGLYDKKTAQFVEKKKGEEFDDRFLDAVTSNLLDENTWYANSIDSNYYYSEYLESLDLYIIYGFEIKKLFILS